jgi:hypothetical protein
VSTGIRSPAASSLTTLGHAVVFALVAGLVAFRAQYLLHAHGADQVALYSAAHTLWRGGNPYLPIIDSEHTVYYPLPAIWVTMLFAWMPRELSAFVFVVVSAGLLGAALARADWRYAPLVLSLPFLVGAQFAQTAILVTALGVLAPGFAFIKPNLGVALFAWRPARRTAIFAAVVLALSLVAWPRWPLDWITVSRASPVHVAPWQMGIGAVGFVGLIALRRPAGRLLTAMTVIPQAPFFYDQLPLALVAETRREVMAFTAMTWFGWLGWMLCTDGSIAALRPFAIGSSFVAAAGVVLWQDWQKRTADTMPAD